MTFGQYEWIIPILAVVGFVIGFLITIKQQKIQGLSEVIDTITTKYLDARKFKFADITQDLRLPDEVAKQALKELERRDIVYRSKAGYFQLNDPLVFLSEQDMIRAKRLTKGDNIIYGAYQHPFFSHRQLLFVYAIFFATIIFALVCAFVPSANAWIVGLLPSPAGQVDVLIFLLFIILVGMITTAAIDNLISVWSRERFSVIIGENSGISFDTSYSDEFSGRIGRGVIKKVDINFSPLQKFANYFMRIPIGDIIINSGKADIPEEIAPKPPAAKAKTTKTKTTKAAKTKATTTAKAPGITFKNMPFPREMFYVIRSLQLRSLGWRQRHARTLMLWRSHGAIPSVSF